MGCKFNLAWVGPCKEETEVEFCEKHSNLKCCSCGELPEGLKGHCKKIEQVYQPWYMRETNNEVNE